MENYIGLHCVKIMGVEYFNIFDLTFKKKSVRDSNGNRKSSQCEIRISTKIQPGGSENVYSITEQLSTV